MTEKTTQELIDEQVEIQKARGDFPEEEDTKPEEEEEEEEEEEPTLDEEDSEEEPEAEEDEEEEPEDDAEEDALEEKGIQIPKARFDEVRNKAKDKLDALQAKLDDANAKLQTKVVTEDVEALRTEIDELEDKYEEHLVEGEVKEAREIRKQLRAKNDQLMETRLTQQSQTTGKSTIEQIRFDTQLAAYEVRHPVLNPEAKEFDQETVDEVTDLLSAFQGQGYNAVAALNKAVKYVVKSTEKIEEVDDEKIDADAKKKAMAAKARRKAASAKKKSPPDTSGAGRDSDQGGTGDGLPDVSKMTIEQFDALSDQDLRAIRGDKLQ